MLTTNFLVKKRKISQLDSVPYTGEYNIDTFRFEFDEEWEGLDKTLVLISGGNRYNIALLNNEALMPFEMYQIKGNVQIGLFGTDNGYRTLATGWLPLYIEEDSYEVNTEPENLPTPTQWDLYVTEINRLLGLCQASEEQCESIASQLALDYQQYLEEFNQIKDDIEDLKDDTQSIYENTNQIKSDVQTIKRQIDEEKQEIEQKIESFDDNYETKLSSFNTNATQKTNAFNENYTEKLGIINQKASDFDTNATAKTNAFNQNASNKTSAFDSNASTKTGAFNDNASSKTSAFNSNATSKTGDFNTNATNKTTAFNENYVEKYNSVTEAGTDALTDIKEAEETAIAHIQEEGASYDERLDDLELLASNFDENTTEPSDDITIEDALNAKAKISVLGKTKQNTYEGYQLINFSALQQGWSASASVTGTADNIDVDRIGSDASLFEIDCEENTQYTISGVITCSNLNGGFGIQYKDGTKEAIKSYTTDLSNLSFSKTSNVEKQVAGLYIILYGGATTINLKNLTMAKGTVAKDYEPYVGGQPSPSPNYAQEMENVSGEFDIGSSNKNVLNNISTWGTIGTYKATQTHTNTSITVVGTETATSNNANAKIYKCKAGKTYTFSCKATSTNSHVNVALFKNTTSNSIGSGDVVSSSGIYNISKGFTAESDFDLLAYFYPNQGYSSIATATFYDFQIEEGTQQTSSIEHKGKSVTLTLPEGMDLREVGNYRDMLFKNIEGSKYYNKNLALGKWFWHKEIIQRKLDNLNFNRSVLSSGNVVFSVNLGYRGITSEICVLSSHFKGIPDSYGNVLNSIRIASSGNCFIIVPDEERFATVASFKSWLTENNVIVQFILKNADVTNTEITDSTLLAQLEELEKLETYKGVTHIYATSDGLAPDLEVTYLVNPLASIEARLELLEE